MKKAILFTLGLFFLVTTVFSLAVLFFHGMLESEDVFLRFASLDRAYELDASLQNSLKEIFNSQSGISVSITGSNVLFQDYLPNPNRGKLASALNNFENYAEENDLNTDIDPSEIITNTSLIVKPCNLTYSHSSFGDNVTYVYPSASSNVTSYAAYLNTGNVNVTGIEWDSISSGDLYFEVIADDNQGNSYTDNKLIDGSLFNLLSVSTHEGNIKIKIWNSSIFSVNNTADVNLSLITDVGFGSSNIGNEVILSGDIININFEDFGIRKKSGVRLI